MPASIAVRRHPGWSSDSAEIDSARSSSDNACTMKPGSRSALFVAAGFTFYFGA